MCKARLTISNHASILDWLQRVRMAACCPADHDCGIPPMRDAWLADGIQIRLPGMIIKHAGEKANSLDLWLQRGRLISAFRPDQGFLRVHVNLLAELPAGDLERDRKHTSELQSLMRISYAVFCLKKKTYLVIRWSKIIHK